MRNLRRMNCLFFIVVVLLSACGTSPISSAKPTSTPLVTSTPIATSEQCNPADFPTNGEGPTGTKIVGPPTKDFQYPPNTYYFTIGGAAGSYVYTVCSSGDAQSILAFMKNAIPTGGWTVLSTTQTTVTAQKPTNPPSGYCYGLVVEVGIQAQYPSEWRITFHSPAVSCV